MKRIPKLIPSSTEQGVMHSVMLVFSDDGEFIPEASSCTCIWGSWYRWRKKNITKSCRHIKQALEKYDNEQTNKFKEVVKENSQFNSRT